MNGFFFIEITEALIKDSKSSTKEILSMLKHLRWIVVQDTIVLIGAHNRKPDIFQSLPFEKITSLMTNLFII